MRDKGTTALERDVSSLVQPRSVAVLGASAHRRTQGNGVIQNLQKSGFRGRIIPIHPTAEAVDGLPVASAIDRFRRAPILRSSPFRRPASPPP